MRAFASVCLNLDKLCVKYDLYDISTNTFFFSRMIITEAKCAILEYLPEGTDILSNEAAVYELLRIVILRLLYV